MIQGIPDKIQLLKFASKSLILSHTYKIRDFPRISKLTSSQDSTLDVKLNFSLKNNRIPCIQGEIELDLVLTCQRCLDDVNIHLNPKFKLAFVQNEQQGEEFDTSFEIILNTAEEFPSIEFITDEVLIAVPMAPMHQYKCSSHQNDQSINIKKSVSPFAILKQLKR